MNLDKAIEEIQRLDAIRGGGWKKIVTKADSETITKRLDELKIKYTIEEMGYLVKIESDHSAWA